MHEIINMPSLIKFFHSHDLRIRAVEKGNIDCLIESPTALHRLPRLVTHIGAYSFAGNDLRAHVQCKIGRYCAIAHNVELGPAEHPTSFLSVNNIFYAKKAPTGFGHHYEEFSEAAKGEKEKANTLHRTMTQRPVNIGNDVWIGANAIVKRGVTIGDGAVIAGGAFVAKDVANYEIVGGIPARHIRFRFSEDAIAKLLELKWWNLPLSDLSLLPFSRIDECIKALKGIRSSKMKGTMPIKYRVQSTSGETFEITKIHAGNSAEIPEMRPHVDEDAAL